MEFPKLKEEEMELFYGDKDEEGNINWVSADEQLVFNTGLTDNNNTACRAVYKLPYPDNENRKRFKSKFKMYKSLNAQVYYEDKLLTIEQLAHSLQKKGVDKDIDSLFIPAYEFYQGLAYNPNFKYDTIKRYRIVSCKDIESENEYKEKERKITEERAEANRKYHEEWWKQNDDGTFEGKLQRYYAPSTVGKLGWINCDRFYQNPQNIETPVEVPNIFTNADIQYFLIYKSFSGLMSGKLTKNANQQFVLSNLPAGEKVTIVAFAKQQGQLYNCKEDFTISKGKSIKADFKAISAEEMNTMFGSNIRM